MSPSGPLSDLSSLPRRSLWERVGRCVSVVPVFLVFSWDLSAEPLFKSGTQIAAQQAEETIFPDNIATYESNDVAITAVKDILVNHLQAGYRTFDVSLIEPVLAPDFQRRVIVSEDSALIESRKDYLEARRGWDNTSANSRKVLYAIQSASSNETRTRVNVLLVATYTSTYFSPRYLEAFLFEKIEGRWLVKRQVATLMHPKALEAYQVSIVIGKRARKFASQFQEVALTKGPDSAIDSFSEKSYERIPLERWVSILFVFREPPPVGAKITTELIYERRYGKFPFRYDYTIEKSEPFFVIENRTYSEDLGGTFVMRVFINDHMIAEKRVRA